MSCAAISSCGLISAYIECLPEIYQGTDYYLEIQLRDEQGLPLDLTQFSGIFMCLYGDGYTYANYTWPETTGNEPIIIIQTTDTAGNIIDQGIIGFTITSEISSKFLTGNLFAEIKFKQTFTDGDQFKVISCLKIGNIKYSRTRNLNDF